MLIDWFTVGAQALNFVVLVWLLKRFLYRPVLDAIDAREAAHRPADRRRRGARSERRGAAAGLRGTRARPSSVSAPTWWTRPAHDARVERERLIAAARQAADEIAAKRQEALQQRGGATERRVSARAPPRGVRHHAQGAGRPGDGRASKNAWPTCSSGAWRELDGPASGRHCRRADRAGCGTPSLQQRLCAAARATRGHRGGGQDVHGAPISPLRFETAPDLVGGIELVGGGQQAGLEHRRRTSTHSSARSRADGARAGAARAGGQASPA